MKKAYLAMGALSIIIFGALTSSERTIKGATEYFSKGLNITVIKEMLYALMNATIYVFTGVSLLLFAFN